MQMSRSQILALCALLTIGVSAADMPAAVKAVELPFGKEPLRVDGDFSDWGGKIAWRDDFVSYDRRTQTEARCRFALRRDRLNLYVAWRADGAYRASEEHVRHDGDIWRGNSVVELFFARPNSVNGYFQFSVAANGDLQDSADGDSFVTPDWEAAAKSDEQGWQAEVRIPFASLERMDYKFTDTIRMNVCMGLPKTKGAVKKAAIWSLGDGVGYKDVGDMGFVAIGSFAKDSARAIAAFEKTYGEKPSAPAVAKGDERGYLAFLNVLAMEREKKDGERLARMSARIAGQPGLPPILAQTWNPDATFGETPTAQAGVLEDALDAQGRTLTLAFDSAINETTHRSFALSATKATAGVTFEASDLRNGEKTIPASRLHVARFAFLHTPGDMRNDGRAAALPYPEIVERVRVPQSFKAGESSLFRLYVDTRGANPGDYSGELAVKVGGAAAARIRVSARVADLALPLPETHPFDVYLFTTIPWGGESAELWARFFRDHYMTDVSFEHPTGYLDGKPLDGRDAKRSRKAKAATREESYKAYADWMLEKEEVPAPGRIRFDLSAFKMDERLRACAKYNLRAVVSSRSGRLKSEYFPAMMEALKAVGIGTGNFIYKLGDEDNSLVYLPVAKRLRELVPDLRTLMIPSGASYWDIKPAAEGFTDFTFSAAAYRGGEKMYADIAYLRRKGVQVSRYLNSASWAGRTLPVNARGEPWAALVVDGLDGYTCWTSGLRPNLGFKTGYSGYNGKYKIHELPPEKQLAAMLVYIRKVGDVYYPVSCIRLENIRDGLIDALYFRLAKERAEKGGDKAMSAELGKIATSPRRTLSDYDAARAQLRAMLRKMKN